MEAVIAARPDLIVDAGSTRPTFVELADRVQGQTGIPYALLDGRFAAILDSYAVLGALTGRAARAAELAEAMREIRQLADGGLAVLFTTHDPNLAARFAHQALLIRAGGIQAQGPVGQVLGRERLEALYGSAVEEIEDREGRGRAFLPG